MKLTPRGYFVAGFLTALAIGALWYITAHVWYIGGEYCLNTIEHCLLEESK